MTPLIEWGTPGGLACDLGPLVLQESRHSASSEVTVRVRVAEDEPFHEEDVLAAEQGAGGMAWVNDRRINGGYPKSAHRPVGSS